MRRRQQRGKCGQVWELSHPRCSGTLTLRAQDPAASRSHRSHRTYYVSFSSVLPSHRKVPFLSVSSNVARPLGAASFDRYRLRRTSQSEHIVLLDRYVLAAFQQSRKMVQSKIGRRIRTGYCIRHPEHTAKYATKAQLQELKTTLKMLKRKVGAPRLRALLMLTT